MIRVNLNREC